MSNRNNISSGSDWEARIGYSRAVRIGAQVSVSGTTASGPDGPVGGDSLAEQTREALRRIVGALAEAGATPEDVIRTRMYVTDMSRWEEAGLAHGEVFGEIRPATTIVEVAKLIDDALLIEIEADAIVS